MTAVSPPAAEGLICVLDTNTVLALWHFADPGLAPLQAALDCGALLPVTSPQALAELAIVLTRPHFVCDEAARTALVAEYRSRCRIVDDLAPAETLPRCRDRDDQKFISLAWNCQARLLLSRDRAVLKLAKRPLLRDRLRICSPEQWCREAGSTH